MNTPSAPGAIYTCPMHPQIRHKGPGHCPICGMGLEPMSAAETGSANSELIDMTRRFWFGAMLALPVVALEMGAHLFDLHDLVAPRASTWIQFALSTPVVLWAGLPFFQRGWASLANHALNMFTLIALGIGAAYGYSLVATLAPGFFPASVRHDGVVPVYYEAAAVMLVLVSEAQRSRAPIQRLADQVSAWFVPAVIAVALLSFAGWMIWGSQPAFANALVAAVSVVIIACPCALGLATSMSIMVGVGKGAGAGILIKNAEALERFEKVDTLVVDKTGTLTEGRPRLIAIVPAKGYDDATLLSLAASLERSSEHPLAAAMLATARERSVPLREGKRFPIRYGQGRHRRG